MKITQSGSDVDKVKEVYALTYGTYAESYITPIKKLEWYFEAELGNLESTGTAKVSRNSLGFNATTGITWYLPAL